MRTTEISAHTLREMQAGAKCLAEKRGEVLDQDYLERLTQTHTRAAALRRWEQEGKLEIEKRSERDHEKNEWKHTILHHVKDGPTFLEDPSVYETGGYPSELLTANIALAIASQGG